MAFTVNELITRAGTDGRVRSVDNQLILAGIDMWARAGQATIIPYPHFESPTEDNGLVKPRKLRGLGDDKFNFHGWYNFSVTEGTEVANGQGLVNGGYVIMDFIASKEDSRGYAGVEGWISNLNVTVDENNKIVEFTGTLDVDGVLPPFGPVV